MIPYINGWINETKKTLALEGGMDKIKDLLAGLKKMACGELSEAAAGTAPVPEVAQVMDVTLAKAAEQNYAYKGRKQYQPPGKPTKDSKTVEGPGAFEDMSDEDPVELGQSHAILFARDARYRQMSSKSGSDAREWARDFAPEAAAKMRVAFPNDEYADAYGKAFATTFADFVMSASESKLEAIHRPLAELLKLVEQGEEGEPAPAGEEPAHAPENPPAEEEPKVSLDVAIKDRLAHGVAEGVINSLSAVYGDSIDFTNPEVMKALDEIERQYMQKGRQFFTELRSEVGNLGAIERDRAIRLAVRVFRELA